MDFLKEAGEKGGILGALVAGLTALTAIVRHMLKSEREKCIAEAREESRKLMEELRSEMERRINSVIEKLDGTRDWIPRITALESDVEAGKRSHTEIIDRIQTLESNLIAEIRRKNA